ncbi:protein transport protein SEC16A homolog [Typha angustifolia]|uniref:protein transport protein SEC16A homolog n=1 Tax=Typha angustifolia TaxID=59011 RepID=UPI003C2D9526
MASPPLFPVEDQTDEDFFDRLVEDDFGMEGSHSESKGMVRDFSSLSLGDEGNSLEEPGDSEFASELDYTQNNNTLQSLEAHKHDASFDAESVLIGSSDVRSAQLGSTTENTEEVESPGSSMLKSSGSKGTSVKEVQWSAFGANTQQFVQGGFDSDSNFSMGDGSLHDWKADAKPKQGFMESPKQGLMENMNQGFMENPLENQTACVGSSDIQDTQIYRSGTEQVVDANDPQYWENLYPGWKYDPSTGQWYQLDNFNATSNGQWDNSAASVKPQDNYEENAHATAYETASVESDISYLQKTAQSVLETIAEESTISNVSNCNQELSGSTEYPPNMVFDIQYPGWYYDTNTQQWYTLESYMQSTQMMVKGLVSEDQSSLAGLTEGNHNLYNEPGHSERSTIQNQGSQELEGDWNASTINYNRQNLWQPEAVGNSQDSQYVSGNNLAQSFYGSMEHSGSHTNQQIGFKTSEHNTIHNYGNFNGIIESQSFVPAESAFRFNPKTVEQSPQVHFPNSITNDQNIISLSQQSFQNTDASYSQLSYTPYEGMSSAGRPAHALVAFGFCGKLIVMKNANSFSTNFGNQGTSGGTVSILTLAEIFMDKNDASIVTNYGASHYFHALCQQSFPGPLVGGNAATKDINRWVDERIMNCESSCTDIRKGESLRLLLSLLKILCQHYGKLRSPFGTNLSQEETDGPETAVTKLFASAKGSDARSREYGSLSHCMQNLPSEDQIRATAIEVQNLLVSGRRKEALQYAQEGQLWGPALVLAAQLGDKFYVDTVKKMAYRQYISGSPLRTLCLLIAGQPADVFSVDSSTNSSYDAANASKQPIGIQPCGMLDGWEENLAIITANRTKDDELVMIHLGDCLWKERAEVTAAHICYLVAEANFESYSESSRLCLIGADHWKCPRTFASPEAIQRTELYEYSKVLGNSQYNLLQFQPYKLIYAYMLAEVGKLADSLRYCQASLKLLKSSSRAPEIETWKSLFSSLEERIRIHQQGGYNTNLAPAKLVGKLFTSIDRSIHRMIGAPPLSPTQIPQDSVNDKNSYPVAPKVVNSQSAVAMSTLMPSASVESISEWTVDSGRKSMHNRSISEPDFGRSPKQNAGLDGAQNKASESGGSRFGRIGSHLFQKTMGWVSRSHHQAKLGESNKFYYDEKLKRWVEEGAEAPAEEPALPPPPTSFENGTPDYNINDTFRYAGNTANGIPEVKPANLSEHSSGIPPIPPSQNQFSARGRMGVRSRYVDTFNKGGVSTTSIFQPSAAAPSVKLASATKFFIPTAPSNIVEQRADEAGEGSHETTMLEEPSTSIPTDTSFSSPSSSSSSFIQRSPSMDLSTPNGIKGPGPALVSGNGSLSRASSWGGTFTDSTAATAQIKPLSSFMPGNPSHNRSSSSSSLQFNSSSLADDLHEVEL